MGSVLSLFGHFGYRVWPMVTFLLDGQDQMYHVSLTQIIIIIKLFFVHTVFVDAPMTFEVKPALKHVHLLDAG